MKNPLKEPLFHFLLIGIGLFVVYEWVNPSESVESDNLIVVSEGRIEQLATIFAKTWQRPPSRQELQGLIDDFVLEEVYYRQAKAMGIDNDDTIIRRRLRQKLEFLTDDTAALVQPTDQELTDFLSSHEGKFRESPNYTFQQAYFNPEKYTADQVAAEISFLQAGKEAGDASLLPSAFQDARRESVDATFGKGFSQLLDDIETGKWQGPLRSGLGFHLVKLDSRQAGRLPSLNEIRVIVEREWQNAKRLEVRQQMNDQLLKAYDIVVEWPADDQQTDTPQSTDRP